MMRTEHFLKAFLKHVPQYLYHVFDSGCETDAISDTV